jgi:hypothetical protein
LGVALACLEIAALANVVGALGGRHGRFCRPHATDAANTVGEIAQALCVSVSFVSKVLSRRRATGERSARPQRGDVRPKLLGLYDAIRAEVKSRPDATLGKLRRWHREPAAD